MARIACALLDCGRYKVKADYSFASLLPEPGCVSARGRVFFNDDDACFRRIMQEFSAVILCSRLSSHHAVGNRVAFLLTLRLAMTGTSKETARVPEKSTSTAKMPSTSTRSRARKGRRSSPFSGSLSPLTDSNPPSSGSERAQKKRRELMWDAMNRNSPRDRQWTSKIGHANIIREQPSVVTSGTRNLQGLLALLKCHRTDRCRPRCTIRRTKTYQESSSAPDCSWGSI